MSKESQIQVISPEEQAEYVQLYLFRELLNNSPPYTFFLPNGDMELHRNRQIFV